MMRKPTVRQRWWSRLFTAAVRWVGVSPDRDELRRAVAEDWRTDTRALGQRWNVSLDNYTERLRNVYRRRWLRLRR